MSRSSLTHNRKRGRFELPAKLSCRFCHEKFETFDNLRFHAQSEHKQEFRQVNRQLAATDAKLRSCEATATEGMRGYKEYVIAGHQTHNPIEYAVQRIEEFTEDEAA